MGRLSTTDSIKGTLREAPFTVEPERLGFWEIRKMPCKRASLFIGALLGNLEGVYLLGLLREKKSISGFLSWTWKPLRFWVWGPSGTLAKNRAVLGWYQFMWHKGPVCKAYVHWERKGWNTMLINQTGKVKFSVRGRVDMRARAHTSVVYIWDSHIAVARWITGAVCGLACACL